LGGLEGLGFFSLSKSSQSGTGENFSISQDKGLIALSHSSFKNISCDLFIALCWLLPGAG
jgi:hypothetical protein